MTKMTMAELEADNAALDAEVDAQLELLAGATMADMPQLVRIMRIATADGGSADIRLNLGVASLARIFGHEKPRALSQHRIPTRLLRTVRHRQTSAPTTVRPAISTYIRHGHGR